MQGKEIAENYKVQNKIGSGSFGTIWKAINIKTGLEVAVKTEPLESKSKQLYTECKIYSLLHTSEEIQHNPLPQVYYYGIEEDQNILIMDLLGPSLSVLFKRRKIFE